MKMQIREIAAVQGNSQSVGTEQTVLALHCSGGNARQWRTLEQMLDDRYSLLTPEHYGTSPDRMWSGETRLTLADEAEQSLQLIDQAVGDVHLVGHSYGGALALHIALARPTRIASISLFEPCAFHLLPMLGAGVQNALTEITDMAMTIRQAIGNGDSRTAMSRFVDYWNGNGAWQGMKPEHQDHLIGWASNANNAFDALFHETASPENYRKLAMPVKLMLGTCSPASVHAVATGLSRNLADCQLTSMPGVGHMGPLTHAEAVAQMIVDHIESISIDAAGAITAQALIADLPSVAA